MQLYLGSCYQQCIDAYAGFLSEMYFQMVHIGEYRSCIRPEPIMLKIGPIFLSGNS